MRVVVLEDYLNSAANSACIEPMKRVGEVVCYTDPAQSEDENIARMAGADRHTVQKPPQATYLT